MAIIADNTVKSYEAFEEAIYSCVDTLLRNRAALYMMVKEKTTGFSIRFNFNPGEVVNMDVELNQIVHRDTFEENE